MCDGVGTPTGFPYVWTTGSGSGYHPEHLSVASSELILTTTEGLAIGTLDTQDNALGVGLEPGQSFAATVGIVAPPVGASGTFEQAGIWFGTNRFGQSDYAKLVVLSRAVGPSVQLLVEQGDATTGARNVTLSGSPSSIDLELTADAGSLTVAGRFRIDGGSWQSVGAPLTVPNRLFTQDQAGVDPSLGTDSFVGISASHRNGPQPVQFRFADFSVSELSSPPPPPPPPPPAGEVGFEATPTSIGYKPTALREGPDGRLYVLDAMGAIRAYLVNGDGSLSIQSTYHVLPTPSEGIYTALGLEFDPTSTADNLTVWISHSISTGENFSEGLRNSSSVTRVRDLTEARIVTPMITGLPRAIANHAINSLKFGPDGRLYIAVGGQTGAGGPNTEPTEFGTRPEQYYSAALLRADVNRASGWNAASHGDCATAVNDSTGTAQTSPAVDCDVEFVATGLRNLFDFEFGSDGFIYGSDNALGVAGTVPIDYKPSCQGIVDYAANPQFDPGAQADKFHRIAVSGDPTPENVSYRGHPNPARGECVFFDGAFQTSLFDVTVSPPTRYVPALMNMNDAKANEARSFNGIIQYQGSGDAGDLQGDLLLSAFAGPLSTSSPRPQGIYRVDPTNPSRPDRVPVTLGGTPYGWNQPLPLVELADGRIAVGEFRGRTTTTARLVILTPVIADGGGGAGTWSNSAPLPAATLDAGSAGLNGALYVVGGKTSATNRVTTVSRYDPMSSSWTLASSVPGPGREDITVVAHAGLLYAFGGASSNAFVADSPVAAVYDPALNSWNDGAVSDLPTPITGAAGVSWNGRIWLIGGLDQSGNSQAAVRVFDPVTNNWSLGPALPGPRDNAGAAILAGHLYVFGGRNRQGGSGPTTNTVWRLTDPDGSWEARAGMPAPRRAFVIGSAEGKAQLFGGESGTESAIAAVYEFDPVSNAWGTLASMPTGRHGPAGATIDGITYVVGGATTSGATSISAVNEAFTR
ncbi:MAG TPA: kelch repeat-containing protein [Acidimicrobiia bacterium]|nr:kelch repeat-containing protein [Acidimicrobiia bacterium]